MANTGYHINPAGYRAVLNGPEAIAVCQSAAAAASGMVPNSTTDLQAGRRVHADVKTNSEGLDALRTASPRI